MTYYDTSALVKLYVPEAGSETVQRFVGERGMAVNLNDLQDNEARNACVLKAFRGEITPMERIALRVK
jgi:predicted nucleic acid-binding protein